MILSGDTEKAFDKMHLFFLIILIRIFLNYKIWGCHYVLIKASNFYDRNPEENRCRKNIPQHNKAQTNS